MVDKEILQITGSIKIGTAKANNKPQIEIRTSTTDKEKLQEIIKAAWDGKPILFFPEIRNKIRATNMLLEHKIIEREGDTYFFK